MPMALKIIAKKLFSDIISEPENLVKYFFYGILFPLIALILIFVIPILLMVSIPVLLLNADSVSTEAEILKQKETIAIYQYAPVQINQNNLDWIENKKQQYSWCDDIKVTYNFDLSWQHLMAIDAVILKQDFNNVKQDDVVKVGERFLIKETYTETYIVQVKKTRRVKEDDGSYSRETYYEEEERTRAIIKITTKPFTKVLEELGFDDFEKEVAINMYNVILNSDLEGNINLFDDVDINDLKEYPPGSANLPYFNQTDKRWGGSSYGSSNIKNSGCGPTALSMVVAGLTGRTDINPKTMADWSVKNGHRAEGAGSYWSLMTQGGKAYGLDVTAVSRKNPDAIVKALSEGNPVIVSMGRGHFTNGGHFIVLTGVTSDGKITVHDPASVSRSQKAWDLSIIMNESSTNGGANGSPFWIFKP